MASNKRSKLNDKRQKNASEESEEEILESGGSSPSILETGDAGEILSSDGEEDEEASEASEEEPERDAQSQLRNISFGTLAKAQDSLSTKRKRGSDSTPQQEDKLAALRERLRELKEAQKGKKPAKKSADKEEKGDTKKPKKEAKPRSSAGKSAPANDSENDSDGSDDEEEEGGHSRARSSKHAPMSQSSKYQVSRRRDVVDTKKRKVRDPRFGAMAGQVDETKIDRNYSFLQDYQVSEMAELKTAIKKSKNAEETETLKRTLMSMQNRKRAKDDKERQQNVLREHRKKEKEAIKDGKQPFYLKRSELKEQALKDKFGGMKAKEKDRAIERRRKKDSQKEKKSMPAARRVAG